MAPMLRFGQLFPGLILFIALSSPCEFNLRPDNVPVDDGPSAGVLV
jgi:hypothetical protein